MDEAIKTLLKEALELARSARSWRDDVKYFHARQTEAIDRIEKAITIIEDKEVKDD